jgi:hypothetical protein
VEVGPQRGIDRGLPRTIRSVRGQRGRP